MFAVLSRFLLAARIPIMVGLLLGGVYLKGRADCAAKFRKAADKIEREWLGKVAEAEKQAFKEGVLSASRDARNKEISNDIKDKAAQEPDAGAECASADTVERLRSIR